MLQLMGSQRVRHEQVTALNLLKLVTYIKSDLGIRVHREPGLDSKMTG